MDLTTKQQLAILFPEVMGFKLMHLGFGEIKGYQVSFEAANEDLLLHALESLIKVRPKCIGNEDGEIFLCFDSTLEPMTLFPDARAEIKSNERYKEMGLLVNVVGMSFTVYSWVKHKRNAVEKLIVSEKGTDIIRKGIRIVAPDNVAVFTYVFGLDTEGPHFMCRFDEREFKPVPALADVLNVMHGLIACAIDETTNSEPISITLKEALA